MVFKWIMRAFSGHLPPEQLLFLWDFILAYDSLEVLALLASAIVSFRRENLLKVDTQHNVEVRGFIEFFIFLIWGKLKKLIFFF